MHFLASVCVCVRVCVCDRVCGFGCLDVCDHVCGCICQLLTGSSERAYGTGEFTFLSYIEIYCLCAYASSPGSSK